MGDNEPLAECQPPQLIPAFPRGDGFALSRVLPRRGVLTSDDDSSRWAVLLKKPSAWRYVKNTSIGCTECTRPKLSLISWASSPLCVINCILANGYFRVCIYCLYIWTPTDRAKQARNRRGIETMQWGVPCNKYQRTPSLTIHSQ